MDVAVVVEVAEPGVGRGVEEPLEFGGELAAQRGARVAAVTARVDEVRGARMHVGREGRVREDVGRGTGRGHPRVEACLLYTSPSPRDLSTSRMPSSA